MAKKAKKKRRTSKSSGSDVKSEMRRYKKGTAKSGRGGKGGKVKSKKQAIAIGLSKARKKKARRSPRKRSNGAICRHSAVTRHSGRLDVPCHAWRQVSRHMAQNFRVVRRPSTVAL